MITVSRVNGFWWFFFIPRYQQVAELREKISEKHDKRG
jgi:hypothetical protein